MTETIEVVIYVAFEKQKKCKEVEQKIPVLYCTRQSCKRFESLDPNPKMQARTRLWFEARGTTLEFY